MSAVVKNKLLLYADDSAILVYGKRKDIIESALGTELETVSEWLICNKLPSTLVKQNLSYLGPNRGLAKQN